MRNKLFAVLLTAAVYVQASGPLDVYICAGQSNMAGAAVPEELPPELQGPYKEILMFSGNEWVPLQPGKRVGPEISFAVEMQKKLNRPVGIIKLALGGKNLAKDWNPALPQSLYAQLKQMVDAAGKARDIRIAGMIWMQGENDSRYPDMATAYSQNLTNLILTARTDFNSPSMLFVAGRVNPPVNKYTSSSVVRAAQETCAVPLYAFIDCDDLTKNADNLHYDAAGLVEMGRRFSQSVLNLQ